MSAKAALFDAPAKQRWTGSRALVPFVRDSCPQCGGALHSITAAQPALFRHGGYGADLVSTIRWCPTDGWRIEVERQERNPRR